MKVCTLCSMIISDGSGCARSNCPNRGYGSEDNTPKVEPGFTGKADRVVQVGLDRVSDEARIVARRAALIILLIFGAMLFASVLSNNLWGVAKNYKIVTVLEEANVRNSATTDGSMILETLAPGTKLHGHWVQGVTVPSEKWFEIENTGKYVWGGDIGSPSADRPVNNHEQIKKSATSSHDQIGFPDFLNYPSGYSDVSVEWLSFKSSWMKDFKTRIGEAASAESNFSKNASIALWGCGMGCQMGVIVDKSTGYVHDLPLGGEENMGLNINSRRGSNLITATWEKDGYTNNPTCVFEALVWDGNDGFRAVSGYPIEKSGSCY